MPSLEAVVANVNELQNGDKRQVKVGETDVLLLRSNDQFYALGAFCTHNQAPLAEGVLSGECIVCPWHNAYFKWKTGDQLQPPGLDSLACYAVRVDGEQVIVSVPDSASGKREPSMAQYAPDADSRTFVILGAGAAGTHAAETLRVAGYQGRIVMVTKDDRFPYDRTTLSKDYFTGKATREGVMLRAPEFYQQHNIDVLLNKQVVKVDINTKAIAFADGETLNYDSLLLATGGEPRQLDVPGKELQNVFTLRSFADSDRILDAAKNASHAIVIGSSFIGMETAAGLAQKGEENARIKVTVVSPASLPFENILGKELGQVFRQVHEENGVTFKFGQKVTQIEGEGTVKAVILDNNERLPADLVVVGIGVQPVTHYLNGINCTSDRSVLVDEYLCAADSVYAAGDLACYPDWRTQESVRIEHWRIAAQHGRIAAYNMAGRPTQFRGVPVFWSMQFQFPIRYVGHAEEWDEVIIDGDLHERQFIVYYVKNNQVLAAASSQRDTETAAIEALMGLNQMPTAEELRNGSVDLVRRLQG